MNLDSHHLLKLCATCRGVRFFRRTAQKLSSGCGCDVTRGNGKKLIFISAAGDGDISECGESARASLHFEADRGGCDRIAVKPDRFWTYAIMRVLRFLALLPLLLANCVSSSGESGDAPRVKTPLGGIRGSYRVSQHGRQFEAYQGIPYALPPVGKLRFKPPQKVPAWNGEIPATKLGSICLQYSHLPIDPDNRVEGAEDCLYLNVYVPVREEKSSELLPVIFYIHGGCFMYGTGGDMGPNYLMDRDVVFVTINYRLGPLGFLSTEDDVVPGNMGLKDQTMALRWVSENIEWFGGDPKRITLAGLSAGGASVHYQYLSPLSANLFQRGMSFSGTSLDPWTQTENPLEKAKKLGAIMGCPTTSTKELVRCLRYRPAQPLVEAVGDFMPWLYNPYTPFGPVVEKAGDSPFIDRSPLEIITSGDVHDLPWITTVVSEEGLYPAADFVGDRKLLKQLDDNWENIAPHLLDFNYTISKEKLAEVSRKIKEHYLGTKPIDRLNAKQVTLMVGDRLFVVDGEKAARAQAKANQSPVWFYYFSYRGAHSLSEALSHSEENFGVSHADDVYYVISVPYIKSTTTRSDRDMQEELIDIWVSFATNGVAKAPQVEWPEVDPSRKDFQYLHIFAPGKYSIETNDNLGEKKFWSTIDFNENKLKRSSNSARDEF